MKKYAKGRRYEYKIKKLFEENDFIVFRCAGSKPCDLITFNRRNGDVYFVECKSKNPRIKYEIEKMRKRLDHLRAVERLFGLLVFPAVNENENGNEDKDNHAILIKHEAKHLYLSDLLK